MKTFDEAFDVGVAKPEDCGLLKDKLPQYLSMQQELDASDKFWCLINGCIGQLAEGMDAQHCLADLFMSGLIIGIEMEKHE